MAVGGEDLLHVPVGDEVAGRGPAVTGHDDPVPIAESDDRRAVGHLGGVERALQGRWLQADAAPQIGEGGWIAPSADVIGQVVLGAEVGVWFGAVLRGDNEPITVGARTNIQEMVMIHTDPGHPVAIGEGCTIGHRAIVHGCSIGDNTLIGMGATVLDGARIGRNCLIGANALITEGKVVPDNSMVLGAPGKVVRQIDDEGVKSLAASAERYVRNARRFAMGMVQIGATPEDFEPA